MCHDCMRPDPFFPAQDLFKEKVYHTYVQKRSTNFKVRSGFFTDQLMKDELKFSAFLMD